MLVVHKCIQSLHGTSIVNVTVVVIRLMMSKFKCHARDVEWFLYRGLVLVLQLEKYVGSVPTSIRRPSTYS